MIDLTAKALPNTVTVAGKAFLIKTDFRIWLRFMRDIKKHQEFDASYIFEKEMPPAIGIVDILQQFGKPKNPLPRPIRHSDAIPIDFDLDADLIYAAFLEQYGIDLVDIEYLHWHKFLALLNGISEDTRLGKVMGYRCYEKTDKKIDYYDELRRAWEIIEETEEDKALVDELLRAFE